MGPKGAFRRSGWLSLLAVMVVPMTMQAQAAPTAAPDAGQLKAARRVVQASGAEGMILKAMELTIPAQRSQNPTIPAEFWDRFTAKARADIGQLADSLAVIYAKRFSRAELEQLSAFYESPIGRRIAAEQAAIAQESQQLGVRWGTRIGAGIAVEMANEGKPLR